MERVDVKEYDRGGYWRIGFGGLDTSTGYLYVDRLCGDDNFLCDFDVIAEERGLCWDTFSGLER